MDIKNGLDGVYLAPTREECFKEFVKGILNLTVDSSKRKQIELDQANKEKTEIQKRLDEIDELKKQQKEDKIENRKMVLDILKKQGIIED